MMFGHETKDEWLARKGREINVSQAEFDRHFEQMLDRRRAEERAAIDLKGKVAHSAFVKKHFAKRRGE